MSVKETSSGLIYIADIVDVNHDFGVLGILHGYAPLTFSEFPDYWSFAKYKSQLDSKTSVLDNNLLTQIQTFCNTPYDTMTAMEESFYRDYPDIHNNVVMLWGNLFNGGIGLAKYDNDNCVLLGCRGVIESGDKYYSTTVQNTCPYYVTITNSGQDINLIDSMVQPTGTYENGFFIARVHSIDYSTGNTMITNQYRFFTGPIQCIQSYVVSGTSALVEVEFYGTAENCIFNYDCNFTDELPNPNPVMVAENLKYVTARALQWKLYTLSPIVYDYDYTQTADGTTVFGGESSEVPDSPYPPSSTSTDDGGYNTPNRYSEPIHSDGVPDGGAIKTGFTAIYNPSESEMQDFAYFLFSGITENIANVVKRTLVNPIDAVISSHMIHFPPHSNSIGEVRFCGFDTGCQANIVSQQFEIIDYFIDLSDQSNFYRLDSFHDLNAYTKMSIFLPYAGMFELDINQLYNGTLRVRYKIDVLSGNCLIELDATTPNRGGGSRYEDVIATYTGNCACPIPLSAVDYRSIFGATLGAVSSAISGNPIGVVASVANASMGINKSGSINSNMGYMGLQDPYIIIHHPEVNIPSDYNKYKGFPSNIKDYMNSFFVPNEGAYIKASPQTLWDTKGVHCTDEEMEEIKTLLQNGIWVE